MVAAIGERTRTLRLSTGVTLGANLDPLRIAEDYATVDLLSGGRGEPVLGRGTFFPHTFLLMFDMGGMPHTDVARTIELVGAEVIPHLS